VNIQQIVHLISVGFPEERKGGEAEEREIESAVTSSGVPAAATAEDNPQTKEEIMAVNQSVNPQAGGVAVERKAGTLEAYWRKNITYVAILLSIWFLVSYVFGIILADALSGIYLGGFRLGFWFANQGSEVIFVILIVVYVKLMNRLDEEFDVQEK
jgi:putative solute:sodium symporter small subunit